MSFGFGDVMVWRPDGAPWMTAALGAAFLTMIIAMSSRRARRTGSTRRWSTATLALLAMSGVALLWYGVDFVRGGEILWIEGQTVLCGRIVWELEIALWMAGVLLLSAAAVAALRYERLVHATAVGGLVLAQAVLVALAVNVGGLVGPGTLGGPFAPGLGPVFAAAGVTVASLSIALWARIFFAGRA